MQPLQPVIDASYTSVHRRPLDVEDYIDILRRHKAWILGPIFAALVISVVVAFLWPDTYVSSAVIRVVPPQVPESIVASNVNMELAARINSMAQSILSRGVLTGVVTSYNLYPRERQRKSMEDVVEDMRRDVRIGNVVPLTTEEKGVSAFQITFSYSDRIAAQKVTADLASRFINENAKDRQNQSVLTTQFLEDQWKKAKRELDAIEQRLADFRTQNAGRLPDQVNTNWAQLGALENRIANLNGAISRANQEKLLLETELRTARNQLASLAPPPDMGSRGGSDLDDRVAALDRDVSNLETQLAALREHYRDSYPDVQRVVALLNIRKKERDALQEKLAANTEQAKRDTPAVSTRQQYVLDRERQAIEANISRIEAQLKTRAVQVDEYNKELASTDRQVKALQARLAQMPVGEKDYAEIIRDRELAKLRYEELNKKKSESEISQDLERRQAGETLELLDPASLPQTPSEPKRPVLVAVGSGIGLLLGLFLAAAREAKDTSLKNLKDVRAYTQLNILGSVPLLENDLVVRRRRRLAWLAWSTACLLGIAVMAGSVFYYYSSRV